MKPASLSHIAESAWHRILGDLLDTSPVESRPFVLCENVTNLRELVDGVIALLTPLALHRDSQLRASVGRTVAGTIHADSARLGQLMFHLLNRSIQGGAKREISLVVWAQPLKPASQRIFICVMDGVTRSTSYVPAPAQRHGPVTDNPLVAARLRDGDAGLPLCRTLAQRMRGQVVVSSAAELGPRVIFNAPFIVEQQKTLPMATDHCSAPAPRFAHVARQQDTSTSISFEPFESHYLEALCEEGVDLHSFLTIWHQSMEDDLEHLSKLLRERDTGHVRSVLHRLSGAVGLVGARSLAEALRHASMSPTLHDAGSIELLLARAKALVVQLDAPPGACGSTSQ